MRGRAVAPKVSRCPRRAAREALFFQALKRLGGQRLPHPSNALLRNGVDRIDGLASLEIGQGFRVFADLFVGKCTPLVGDGVARRDAYDLAQVSDRAPVIAFPGQIEGAAQISTRPVRVDADSLAVFGDGAGDVTLGRKGTAAMGVK